MNAPRFNRARRTGVSNAGVTLVELLVALGIITVLIGLLLTGMASLRSSASKSLEMTAARQLMAAYHSYANMNRDFVLPGYKTGLPARDRNHTLITDLDVPMVAAARYPWRLAPYLDYQFRGLYLNDQERTLEEIEARSYEDYVYLVSLYPSLGLNTTWLGGNQNELGFNALALDTYGTFYVRRISEVRRPEHLLVFASARGPGQLPGDSDDAVFGGVLEGYHEVRSPRLTVSAGYRWADDFRPQLEPGDYGFLSLRYDDQAVTAFMDGHIGTLSEHQLKDMRYWANQADREDWALVPNP
jgi:type II secretory pathway pseudopilin PulG